MTSYAVTLNMDFTKTVYLHAESEAEAQEKAEALIRNNQKSLSNLGYSIGDIDVIETSECLHPNKARRADRMRHALQVQAERRVFHVD